MLLDDGSAAGRGRLYVDPVEIVTTRKAGEVAAALDALRMATRGGLHAAGYISYDAGAAMEPKLAGSARSDGEALLWFGLFRGYTDIHPTTLLPDADGAWSGSPVPTCSAEDYAICFRRVQDLIAAGDLYQANLTIDARVKVAGDPLALYAGLRSRAASRHGAIVATGQHWLLSLSPESFFRLDDGRIVTRPMKGTAPSDSDPEALRGNPKQRAENLMIVDLLRNDLSRVAVAGSVAVPELFAIERYPTLLQMTSTVVATRAPGRDAIDVLRALFPCGSITGAPKIRAMEAISEIERRPRGVYTGAIGRLDADGGAAFNVAIRTLMIDIGGAEARMGLGSGVVADSRLGEEWRECLAKGDFVATRRRFDLIETMRFEPEAGVLYLDRHLVRMAASADTFGFTFDRHGARNELQAATFRLRAPARVRLVLGQSGATVVEVRDLPPVPEVMQVALVPLPVDASDFRLRHKTSDRAFYDRARGSADEVVFVRPDGGITEGSFTNVFVERDSTLATPPLTDGLLGGVLRGALIDERRAVEAALTSDDLKQGFFVGNALRGLLPARLVGL